MRPESQLGWHYDEEIFVEWELGSTWPILIVNLFEKNAIGERRLVGTRTYRPVEPPPPEVLG